MDELVRKADVLILLHELGGTGTKPGTWENGWDMAIDDAYEKVRAMESVDPEKTEDWDAILDALFSAVQLTKDGAGIEGLAGHTDHNEEDYVEILYHSGCSEMICVSAESGLELIRDVAEALVERLNAGGKP